MKVNMLRYRVTLVSVGIAALCLYGWLLSAINS